MLFGAAALALLGAGATACGSPPPPEIDDLVAQLDLARNDSQLASAAVATAPPQLARALTAVASERSAHARALENEITRATGGGTDGNVDNDQQRTAAEAADDEGRHRRVAHVGEGRRRFGGQAVGVPRRAARVHRRRLHRGLHGGAGLAGEGAVTSAEPTPTTTSSRAAEPTSPSRPPDAGDAALFDAVATEHAVIYGYGLVSAHATPDLNALVSASIAEHRERREKAIAMLGGRSVDAPLPAAGYQLPSQVDNPTNAANLAVRMEEDAAVAWRAVLEQATTDQDRAFAVTALTQCAVAAARWSQVLEVWPITVAFPGGSE